MPPNASEVLALIYGCIDDINDLRLPTEAIEKRPDVILAGEGGCLDSLALAMLILNVERQASKISGKEISLTDTGGSGRCSGTGTYKFKLSGSTLTFSHDTGQGACPGPGKYKYKLTANKLTFTRISDSCSSRPIVLKSTFTKIS